MALELERRVPRQQRVVPDVRTVFVTDAHEQPASAGERTAGDVMFECELVDQRDESLLYAERRERWANRGGCGIIPGR